MMAVSSLILYTPASSGAFSPTNTSGEVLMFSPLTILSRAPGSIFAAQPAALTFSVSLIVFFWLSLIGIIRVEIFILYDYSLIISESKTGPLTQT